MRGPATDNHKDTHLSIRVDRETAEYLDSLGREWGFTRAGGEVNRSQVLRTIIHSHHGILFGNFIGVLDNDRLAAEWGELGHLLAAANESQRGVPGGLERIRLADVLQPIPVLVSAAMTELEHGTPFQEAAGDR